MDSENSETENKSLDASAKKTSTVKRKRGRPKASDQSKKETPNLHIKTESSMVKDEKTDRRHIKKPKRFLDMETEQFEPGELVSPPATKKNSCGGKSDVEENEIKNIDKEILNSSIGKVTSSGKKKGRPKKKNQVQDTSLEDQSEDMSILEIADNSINDVSKLNETSDGMEDVDVQKGSRVDNEQEVKNGETPSGRKRGRPKANKNTVNDVVNLNISTDKELDTNNQTPNNKKHGRHVICNIQNRSIDSEQEDKNEEKEESFIEKTSSGKKRGRPKRVKKENSSQIETDGVDEEIDEIDATSKNNTKGGKQKRSVTQHKLEEQKVQRNNTTGSDGKRLPGRPRKSENSSEPTPKKRGRPKKNLEEELESVRKKRKESITSSDEEEGMTGKSVKAKTKKGSSKKYARKKTEENLESDVELESPLKGETNCVHCDEKFSDKTKLKWHMMKTHCAVWSKDCPEGKTDNAALKEILKRLGKITCPKCGKEIKWIQYYRKHEQWCGRENELSNCPVCDRPIMTMWMKEHVQLHEKQKRLEEEKKLAKDKKDKEEPDSDSEEQTNRGRKKRSAAKKAQNLLHEINEKGELVDQNTVDHASDAEIVSEASDDDDDGDDAQESDEIISEPETKELTISHRPEKSLPYNHISIGLKDTVKFYRKLYGTKVLFPEYMPQKSNWSRIDGNIEQYLPIAKESVNFVVTNKNMKLRKNTDTMKTKMMKLGLFDSVVINDSSCIFVGGPVWGLEWCPVPIATGQFDNYLAVSCQLNCEEITHFSPCTSKPGLIQIWNIQNLKLGKPCSQPKLEFCIAHDYGSVKNIKWCPSRCWQQPDLIPESDGCLPRAGILGLACSDGIIHIYSIPHASALNQTEDSVGAEQSNFSKVKIFKPHPVINLIPSTAKGSWSPCFCMAWQIQNDHRYVVGGYGDGTVRVWNLCTTSPLLKSAGPTGINILPFKTFIGDAKAITCCDWSIHSAMHFSTGGWGQEMKVWSLQDSQYPLMSEKSQATYKVSWSLHTMGVYTCTDDGYCHNHCYVRCNTFGLLKKEDVRRVGQGVSNSNACNWSLTCSDWVKMVFSADNKGRLLGVMMRDPYREYIGKVKKMRLIVYDTDLKQIPTEQNEDTKKENSDSALSLDSLKKENTTSNLIEQPVRPIKSMERNDNDTVMDNIIEQNLVNEKEKSKNKNDIEISMENVSSESVDIQNNVQGSIKACDNLTQKSYLKNFNLKEMTSDKCVKVTTETSNGQKKCLNKNTEILNKEISSSVQANSSDNEKMTETKPVNLKNSSMSRSEAKNVDISLDRVKSFTQSSTQSHSCHIQQQNESRQDTSIGKDTSCRQETSMEQNSSIRQGTNIGQGTSIMKQETNMEQDTNISMDSKNGAENNLNNARVVNSNIFSDSSDKSNSKTMSFKKEMEENISPKAVGNSDKQTVESSSKTLTENEKGDIISPQTTETGDKQNQGKSGKKKQPGKKGKTKDTKNISDSDEKNLPDDKLPKTYQEFVENFYLEYKDYMENNCKVIDIEDKVHVYPSTALYRAVVNPNYHACTWMASGGEAGIIRIHNIFHILNAAGKQEISNRPSISLSNVTKTNQVVDKKSVYKIDIENEKCGSIVDESVSDIVDGQTVKHCVTSKSDIENGHQSGNISSDATADIVEKYSTDDR